MLGPLHAGLSTPHPSFTCFLCVSDQVSLRHSLQGVAPALPRSDLTLIPQVSDTVREVIRPQSRSALDGRRLGVGHPPEQRPLPSLHPVVLTCLPSASDWPCSRVGRKEGN